MSSPYDVVKQFEQAVCNYTGAPYCVTVNSCTMALLLAVKWHFSEMQREIDSEDKANGHGMRRQALFPPIEIPKRTYVSVPQSIIHADGRPTYRDEDWRGWYELSPLNVWDSARYFSSGMFRTIAGIKASPIVCVSFHASKTLGDTQGGAILHDNPEADAWFRKARFDGRTEGVSPKDDHFDMVGYHCYLSADVAARLLLKLHSLPRHNAPLPNDDYPDLSLIEAFK